MSIVDTAPLHHVRQISCARTAAKPVLFALLVSLLTSLSASAPLALAYDKSAASNYAVAYALNPNPAVIDLGCTDFVSQCLCYGGGISQDSHSHDGWWCYNSPYGWTWTVYWPVAANLKGYFQMSPRFHTYYYNIGTYDFLSSTAFPEPQRDQPAILKGDIISYDWDRHAGESANITHSAFISHTNWHSEYKPTWQGDVRCQHQPNRRNEAWTAGDRYSEDERRYWCFIAWGVSSSVW